MVFANRGSGLDLFDEIEGDKKLIMGLPIKSIKKYLESIK